VSSILFKDLGLVSYTEALDIQLLYFESIKAIKINNRDIKLHEITPNYFFFVKHPHVYTLGKNGKKGNILLSDEELQTKNISFYKTNRGGDITYHGPGQVVAYPILDLDNFSTDIHLYMRNLEEVVIKTIADYGLQGQRSKGETGVWLDVDTPKARKICAMGVHTSRWVTMHGFALNVNTDLSFFDGIIPCGIQDKGVTSLAHELGKSIDENSVKEKIIKNFSIVFKAQFYDLSKTNKP
jgi:lipoyl(octanoyl) transferase